MRTDHELFDMMEIMIGCSHAKNPYHFGKMIRSVFVIQRVHNLNPHTLRLQKQYVNLKN